MILPLELLINYNGNIYELTCASIRRSVQLTVTGDEDVAKNDGKVVSLAIRQILTKRVEYKIEK